MADLGRAAVGNCEPFREAVSGDPWLSLGSVEGRAALTEGIKNKSGTREGWFSEEFG